MPTKAVLLIRVSDYRQEKEGLSLDNQEEVLRRYADEHNFEIVKVFRFQETADQKIRTRFMEMVNFVKRHKDVPVIISFRVDRLTRNYRDHVLMDELRTEYDKELHCVYDRLVINRRTIGRDIQDWDTKAYLAKQHINRLKEDALNSAAYKLRHGEWPGKSPYGYRNRRREDNRNWIFQEEFEAKVVRQMFLWYGNGGYSMLQIRRKLKVEFGVAFSLGNIDHILKNSFYYGEMVYDGTTYRHTYEPILSRELFDKVQNVKRGFHKQPHKYGGLPFIYRGVLRCGICGCSITPERKRKKTATYTYYHCTGFKGKHEVPWLREEEITSQFQRLFTGLSIPDSELQKMLAVLKETHKSSAEFTEQTQKELKAHFDRYQHRIDSMYEDKLDGTITDDYFQAKKQEYRAKQRELETQLRQVQMPDEEYYLTVSAVLQTASRSGYLFTVSKLDEKRQLLKMLLQNCVIEDGNVVWELKKPYDTIFHYTQNKQWRPLLDMFRHREADIDPCLYEMRPRLQAIMSDLIDSKAIV